MLPSMMPWTLLLNVPLAPVVADAGTTEVTRWVPMLIGLAVNIVLVSLWAGRMNERVDALRDAQERMYATLTAGIAEIKASMYTRQEADARWQAKIAEHAAFDKRITRIEEHEDA